MITSVRAVSLSPVPMVGWAAIVTVLLIVSSLPMFLGLTRDAADPRAHDLASLSPRGGAGG